MPNRAYNRFNPNLQAECIYLYYFSPSNPLYCDVYFVDRHRYIPPSEMPAEIASIVADIKNGTRQPDATRMSGLDRERKSYFVVVLDEPPLKLIAGDAVRFYQRPGGGDHTFRDGEDVSQVAGYPDISAFFCFNHMIHQSGRVLRRGEREEFRVVLVHSDPPPPPPPPANAFGHEDTGTNLGPPQPPPG